MAIQFCLIFHHFFFLQEDGVDRSLVSDSGVIILHLFDYVTNEEAEDRVKHLAQAIGKFFFPFIHIEGSIIIIMLIRCSSFLHTLPCFFSLTIIFSFLSPLSFLRSTKSHWWLFWMQLLCVFLWSLPPGTSLPYLPVREPTTCNKKTSLSKGEIVRFDMATWLIDLVAKLEGSVYIYFFTQMYM